MHGNIIAERIRDARETERQIRQGTAKIVSVCKFGNVAKVLWPINTAAHVATIGQTNERTAARWLSGEFEPPGIVIAAIVYEITRRDSSACITGADNGKSRGRNAEVDSGRSSAPS